MYWTRKYISKQNIQDKAYLEQGFKIYFRESWVTPIAIWQTNCGDDSLKTMNYLVQVVF